VEVKKIPSITVDESLWALRVHRNLAAHSALIAGVPFVLAAMPKRFYFWPGSTSTDPNAQYRNTVELDSEAQAHFANIMEAHDHDRLLEHEVAAWLSAALWSRESHWMNDDPLQKYFASREHLKWQFLR
jgi:hypothetical protein